MKKLMIVAVAIATVASIGTLKTQAAQSDTQLIINNGNDDGIAPIKIVTLVEWQKSHGGQVSAHQVGPSMSIGGEGVAVVSLCASGSSSLNQSYINSRLAAFGKSVPTDRTTNPAAWYQIPTGGFQWFDFVSTPNFPSWLGVANPAGETVVAEHGSRIVIDEWGTSPVNAYALTINSSVLSIGGPTSFNIASNYNNGVAQSEIGFNLNFIGINAGANGIIESFPDPSSGAMVVGGDDVVLTSGLPSQSTYGFWWRFGSSVTVSISTPTAFNAMRDSFNAGSQWLTVSIAKSGVAVQTVMLKSSEPVLTIDPMSLGGSPHTWVSINGGPEGLSYNLLTSTNLGEQPIVWVPYGSSTYMSGDRVLVLGDAQRYFRLRSVTTP